MTKPIRRRSPEKPDVACAIVNTTMPDEAAARRMASRIVTSRLAACAQIMPIHSVYRWKGRIESAPECLVVCKTRASLAERLVRFIRRHHPYEVPEILFQPILGGLPEYVAWIDAETRREPKKAGDKRRRGH